MSDRHAPPRLPWIAPALAALALAAGCGGSEAGEPFTPTAVPAPSWLNTGVRIMPLGDSITEGWPSTGGGYRTELYRRFVDADLPVNLVGSQTFHSDLVPDPDHDGHPGWTAYELRAGRYEDPGAGSLQGWLAAAQPQIVLCWAGVNDLFTSAADEDIARSVLATARAVRQWAPAAHVFVGTLPPNRMGGTIQPRPALVNGFLVPLVQSAAADDDHLHLVDLAAVLTWDDVASDGLHLAPNGYGNPHVAQAFYEAIHDLVVSLEP